MASQHTTSLFISYILILVCLITPSLACDSDNDCENGGACVSGKCQCPLGYVGKTCGQQIEDYLGGYYVAYNYTTSVVTICLFIASSCKLGWMFYINREFTMKHFTILLMVIATLLRSIAYGVELDGNWTRYDTLEPFSGLCYFLFYSLCVSAYLCELFIWIELYTATTLHQIEHLPTYKKIFYAINGFLFPLEFVTRIIIAELDGTAVASLIFAIWMIYIGLVCIVETVGFFVMASLLMKKMFHLSSITGVKEGKSQFIKISILTLSNAGLLLLGLGIVVWFFFAKDVWTWYALLWFSRTVESLFVVCLLVTVRTPKPLGSRAVSLQLSSSYGQRRYADEATIGVSGSRWSTGERSSTLEEEDHDDGTIDH